MAAEADSFFAGINGQFSAIALDNGELPAEAFLDAVSAWLPLFDKLGKVFFPVKSDIGGNVEKLRKARAASGAATIQKLLQPEIDAAKTKSSGSATESLLWLKRALEFMLLLLEKVSSTKNELNACAKEAYEVTLSNYHGFMVRKTFQVGLMAAPARAGTIAALGPSEDVVVKDMSEWCSIIKPLLENVNTFYSTNNLDDKSKV